MTRAQLTVDGHVYKPLVYKERKKEKDTGKKGESGSKKKDKIATPGQIRDYGGGDDDDHADDDDDDDDDAEDYEHPDSDDDVVDDSQSAAPSFVPASERWPLISVASVAACAQAQQAIAAHKSVALGVIGDVKSDSSSFVRLVSVAVMTEPSLGVADVAQIADTANVSRGSVFVFDLHSDVETMLAIHKMLSYLLKDDDVTKVMCDARHALPALKVALRLATTEVNNIYDTLVAYQSLRRILERAQSSSSSTTATAPALSRLTAIDAQLALELPLTTLSDALPTGGTVWHNEPLLGVQLEFAADRVRHLLPLRARIQLELTDAIERVSDVTARWYSMRKRLTTLDVLLGGEVLAMAFDSDPRRYNVLHLVAHRGVTYQQPSAADLRKATEARWVAAAEASRADVLALLDTLPSVLRAAVLKFANNDPILFAARVQAIFFGVGSPARLQLRGTGDFEILRECVWTADQFKQFQLALGEKGLVSAAVDVVPLRRTLHRLSIRREGDAVVGLKCRVVLAFTGAMSLLRDVITEVATQHTAVLLFGRVQVGKTAVLREISQELAYTRRTVVVDTYGDVGGDSQVRHASLGDAFVLRVPAAGADTDGADRQVACMQEALHNWSAECVVVDELTWESQIDCVTSLKANGVGVVCGARTESLSKLYEEFAVLQSNNPFDAMIEVHSHHRFTLHTTQATTAAAVAAILPVSERWYDATSPEQRWIRCSSTTAAW
jgi:stage III sporulation protein SpoIIIAA